jgi:hypothetical protein
MMAAVQVPAVVFRIATKIMLRLSWMMFSPLQIALAGPGAMKE